MDFRYYTSYVVQGAKSADIDWMEGMLVRAPVRLEGDKYQFFLAGESSVPTLSMQLAETRRLPNGAVTARYVETGDVLKFVPFSLPDMKRHAGNLGIEAPLAASAKSVGDLTLIMHDMAVPEYYDEEFEPVQEQTEGQAPPLAPSDISQLVEEEYWLLEGQEAPVGTTHRWERTGKTYTKVTETEWSAAGVSEAAAPDLAVAPGTLRLAKNGFFYEAQPDGSWSKVDWFP